MPRVTALRDFPDRGDPFFNDAARSLFRRLVKCRRSRLLCAFLFGFAESLRFVRARFCARCRFSEINECFFRELLTDDLRFMRLMLA